LIKKEGSSMTWQERTFIDPLILASKYVIKGTRLAVEFIVGLSAEGWSEEDTVKYYKGLTREDIHECLGYTSAVLKSEKVYPLPVSNP